MTHIPAPKLIRGDDAELLGAPPVTMRLLADGSDTGGAFSAIRSTLGKDTDGPPPHHHAANPEMFYILEGGLHVLVGTEVVTARTGDFLYVPQDTVHAFRTPTDTGVDMLFFMPNVDRFEYFRMGVRLRRGEITREEFDAAQERFDNHWTDSPTWREFVESMR